VVAFFALSAEDEGTAMRFHEEDDDPVRRDLNCVWTWLSADVQESRSLNSNQKT